MTRTDRIIKIAGLTLLLLSMPLCRTHAQPGPKDKEISATILGAGSNRIIIDLARESIAGTGDIKPYSITVFVPSIRFSWFLTHKLSIVTGAEFSVFSNISLNQYSIADGSETLRTAYHLEAYRLSIIQIPIHARYYLPISNNHRFSLYCELGLSAGLKVNEKEQRFRNEGQITKNDLHLAVSRLYPHNQTGNMENEYCKSSFFHPFQLMLDFEAGICMRAGPVVSFYLSPFCSIGLYRPAGTNGRPFLKEEGGVVTQNIVILSENTLADGHSEPFAKNLRLFSFGFTARLAFTLRAAEHFQDR